MVVVAAMQESQRRRGHSEGENLEGKEVGGLFTGLYEVDLDRSLNWAAGRWPDKTFWRSTRAITLEPS